MKNTYPQYHQILFTSKERAPMLRIEIPKKDLNDEKANKLIFIVSAIANIDEVEVVIIEE